jgi:hypothetical protein
MAGGMGGGALVAAGFLSEAPKQMQGCAGLVRRGGRQSVLGAEQRLEPVVFEPGVKIGGRAHARKDFQPPFGAGRQLGS